MHNWLECINFGGESSTMPFQNHPGKVNCEVDENWYFSERKWSTIFFCEIHAYFPMKRLMEFWANTIGMRINLDMARSLEWFNSFQMLVDCENSHSKLHLRFLYRKNVDKTNMRVSGNSNLGGQMTFSFIWLFFFFFSLLNEWQILE